MTAAATAGVGFAPFSPFFFVFSFFIFFLHCRCAKSRHIGRKRETHTLKHATLECRPALHRTSPTSLAYWICRRYSGCRRGEGRRSRDLPIGCTSCSFAGCHLHTLSSHRYNVILSTVVCDMYFAFSCIRLHLVSPSPVLGLSPVFRLKRLSASLPVN